jgi:hypothetical protein
VLGGTIKRLKGLDDHVPHGRILLKVAEPAEHRHGQFGQTVLQASFSTTLDLASRWRKT